MNYGIYKKDVFRKHGLYNKHYRYYCADGECLCEPFMEDVNSKLSEYKVLVLPAKKGDD